MIAFKHTVRGLPFFNDLWQLKQLFNWRKSKFAAPSPQFIKIGCIVRNSLQNGIWVETGTYLGDTTSELAKISPRVISIEPAEFLFQRATKRFSDASNVQIIQGTSEAVFPDLLSGLDGDVNFWLDGHYSEGATFKGALDTPVVDELANISNNLERFSRVCVMVDDVRCFNPHIEKYADYPNLDFLVKWANDNQLVWHIEHDIFVAKTSVRL